MYLLVLNMKNHGFWGFYASRLNHPFCEYPSGSSSNFDQIAQKVAVLLVLNDGIIRFEISQF